MHEYLVVEVQFYKDGRFYDFLAGDVSCQAGDRVMVESDRGPVMVVVRGLKYLSQPEKTLKSVLRKAQPKDFQRNQNPEDILEFAKQKIEELGLDMRILKCDPQHHAGVNKILIYFIAPGRVDFRELVKELASGLKARVELKQVGARDETKILGGLGICGREYCCSSFLKDFVPVSIRMAKNQNLALNPGKVSGGCGRLLCCLTYEDDTYSKLRMFLPPLGSRVLLKSTKEEGLVIRADLFNQEVLVQDLTHSEKEYLWKVSQIEILERPKDLEDPSLEKDWGDDLDLDALEAHIEKQDRKKKFPNKF